MNDFGESSGFGGFLSEMPFFFKLFGGLIFTIVIGMIVLAISKGLSTWFANNAAQLISQRCKIVDKRTEVWGGSGNSSTSTNYYLTFEFEDSSRQELPVSAKQFGLLVSGDQGELTYQGTRFKAFKRLMV
jgi:hypothetical protein